jgi:membrane-bound lytic murein transglycosylase D
MHIRFSRFRLLGHRSLEPSLAAPALAALALLLSGCTPTDSGKTAQKVKPQATAPAITPQQQAPQAAASPAAAPLSGDQRRTRALIQQVEHTYLQGQAAYRKGNLAEAKINFDGAVDLMLSSGFDIKLNQPLQDEFDRVVDGINALEMESLKQGNGFVPKEEPTPAEVANDVTFEVDPNISAKARADLATTKSDLPLVVNDYVDAYIKFFSTTKIGHNTLLHSFQRAGRYRTMIQRVMGEEGMPQDLIYLAVAESGFNPRAIGPRTRSGLRAGGMWQFMPNDQFYGLARNAYVDERFDPEKSTRAYARYMKFIYNQLGDWYLSMAGYNWGTGRIQQAVQKTGYADFWELYRRNNLPGETKNYVPQIIAAIIIANNPTHYGFEDITLDPPLLTDTITIDYSVDLRLVADIINVPEDELIALNPSLLRSVTPPDAPFDLHLPAGTSTLFTERIAAIPETKRSAWRYHRVGADDTLASLAHEFHVSEDELASVNQLRPSGSLQGVEAIIVPVAPPAASTHVLLYTARKGDTLVTIADRFGVSLTQLRRWNKMSGIKIEPGRHLHVAEPSIASSSPRAHHASGSSSAKADAAKPSLTKGSASKSPQSSSAKKSHNASPSSKSTSSATKKKPSTAAN